MQNSGSFKGHNQRLLCNSAFNTSSGMPPPAPAKAYSTASVLLINVCTRVFIQAVNVYSAELICLRRCNLIQGVHRCIVSVSFHPDTHNNAAQQWRRTESRHHLLSVYICVYLLRVYCLQKSNDKNRRRISIFGRCIWHCIPCIEIDVCHAAYTYITYRRALK